jgi:hypothetical protein
MKFLFYSIMAALFIAAPAMGMGQDIPQDEMLALQPTEAGKQMLLSKLELVAQGQFPPQDKRPHLYAIQFVEAAGDAGDRRFAPVLIQIIEISSKKPQSGPVREAFQSLQKLNEPKETFLTYANEYHGNPSVTGFALEALAATPNDPDVIRLIDKIQNDIRDKGSPLQSFINTSKGVRSDVRKYESKQTIEEKIDHLLPWSFLGYNSPSAVWAHRKLGEVSEQYPDKVAQAIFRLRSDPNYIKEHFYFDGNYEMVRNQLAKFISADALAMLEALEQGKDIASLVQAHDDKIAVEKALTAQAAALKPSEGSPSLSKTSAPKISAVPSGSESGPDWFLILASAAAVVLTGAVAFRFWKK